MSIARDLTVTVTNESEGVTITFKTVSSLGKDKVFISGDAAVHDVKEIQEALKEIQKFQAEATVVAPEGERIEGIHLP